MLNDEEKRGAALMLSFIEDSELVSLSKTVTSNQIVSRTKDEAIRAICTFSVSPVELLKRKKVKRETLFRYLVISNVTVDPKAGKVVLARQVLNLWGIKNVDMLDLMEIGNDIPPTGGFAMAATPRAQPQASLADIQQCHATQPPATSRVPSLLQQSALTLQNNQHLQTPPSSQTRQQPPCHSNIAQDSWIADFLNFERSVQASPQDEEMGREFCRWFYRMLNACNPCGQPCNTPLITQHFFPDCSLKILIMNSKEIQNFEGSTAVCEKLASLARDEQLIFNANVDVGGVMTMATPHGLKMLIACGTLHKGSGVIGVFAQQFGLVRNPAQDFNWNIKYSNLKMIAGTPSGPPTLQNPGNMLPLTQ